MTYPTLGIVTEDSAMFVARITCINNDFSTHIRKIVTFINFRDNIVVSSGLFTMLMY